MDISQFTVFQISLPIVKCEFNYTSVFGVGTWGTNETRVSIFRSRGNSR